MSDTIAAIATPGQPSAIGILRLSGPDTCAALDAVFRAKNGRPAAQQRPRAMVLGELLDDMAEKFAEVDDELCDVEDGLDAVSDDLSDVEETLYFALDDDEDDEEDDEEEECFVTTCPECEEEIFFDDTMLEDGEIICPNCGAKLEFDLSDLADAADEDKDEE